MMLAAVLSLVLVAANAAPSNQTLRADAIQQCSNHPDGFCIDTTQFECPAGWLFSYSGCGFLEKCCYPNHGGSGSPATTASSGVTGGHCGRSTVQPGLKIVGGETTTIEAHPWQISLRENGHHICGGSLVADNWVMTAAHCVEDAQSVSSISILAGSTSISHYSRSKVHQVSRVLYHQAYGSQRGHDIAMIKLTTPVDLSASNTRTICLADPTESFSGQTCIASGWGYTREGGNVVATLRHVALPIITNSLCSYYMGGVHDKILCAGRTAGGVDTCQGDSGGPLVCQRQDGSWVQAGIVSNGVGCARRNKFGFYTAVSQFDDWIQGIIDRY